jgi:hypothetical protein
LFNSVKPRGACQRLPKKLFKKIVIVCCYYFGVGVPIVTIEFTLIIEFALTTEFTLTCILEKMLA